MHYVVSVGTDFAKRRLSNVPKLARLVHRAL